MTTVQQLIEEKVLVYNQNPLTQEHIVSIDTTKTPQKYKANAYYINVDQQNIPLVVNHLDNNFLYAVIDPTLASIENIKSAIVKMEK